jgi:hypothetical protein
MKNKILAIISISFLFYLGCNGKSGSVGPKGPQGFSLVYYAESFTSTTGTNCPANGGIMIESGVDDDRDDELDRPDEVDHTSYLCHGETGQNGETAILWPTPIAPGGGVCGNEGGMKIENGLDLNGNLRLDPSEPIISFFTVCNGPQGIQGIPGIQGPVGAQGPQGTQGNNGSNSLVVLNLITPSPNQIPCPTGGTEVKTGVDINNNFILDPNEIAFSQPVCNGTNSLVCPTTGAYPENCVDGGIRWQVGLDLNGDGILTGSEIDQNKTSYACFSCQFTEDIVNTSLACRRDFGENFSSSFAFTTINSLGDKIDFGPHIAGADNGTVYMAVQGGTFLNRNYVYSYQRPTLAPTTQRYIELSYQAPQNALYWVFDIDTDGTDAIIPLHDSNINVTTLKRWTGQASGGGIPLNVTDVMTYADPPMGFPYVTRQIEFFDLFSELYLASRDQAIIEMRANTTISGTTVGATTVLSLASYERKNAQGAIMGQELYSLDLFQGMSPNPLDITKIDVGLPGASYTPQRHHQMSAGVPTAITVDSKGNLYVSCAELVNVFSPQRIQGTCDLGSVIKIDAQGNEIPILKTNYWIIDLDYIESQHTLVTVSNQGNQFVIERFRILEEQQGFQLTP